MAAIIAYGSLSSGLPLNGIIMRHFQGFGDLLCNPQRFVQRKRTSSNPLGEHLALHQLHHDGLVFQPVDRRDVGVSPHRGAQGFRKHPSECQRLETWRLNDSI